MKVIVFLKVTLFGILFTSNHSVAFLLQTTNEGSSASIISRCSWSRKNQAQDDREGKVLDIDLESKVLLPIFPLRKSVRLPTDVLTLNLYEPRYLALSEYILTEQEAPFFGALYTADKPQLVKNAQGSATPIVEKGDLGVLCMVRDWDDQVNPVENGDLRTFRRKIRLDAVAVCRFKIESVVSKGVGKTALGESSIPFILAEASLLSDIDEPDVAFIDSLVQHIRNDMKELSANRLQKIFRPVDASSKEDKNLDEIVNEVLSLVEYSTDDPLSRRSELFSFAAASRLYKTRNGPRDMMSLLRIESTQERLKKLSQR